MTITAPTLNYPDPSILTTDAIEREVSVIQRDLLAMRETLRDDVANREASRLREQKFQEDLFHAKVDGIQKAFDVKIKAIDAEADLRLQAIRDVPDSIVKEIGHHEDLQKERFAGIAQQFAERDIRTSQASDASAQALAAALQAAKELVGAQGEASAAAAVKSETSFTKQIDQIGTIIQTLEKALDARITELKERIDRGEGTQSGAHEQVVNQRGANSQQIAVIGVALIAISIIEPFITQMLFK